MTHDHEADWDEMAAGYLEMVDPLEPAFAEVSQKLLAAVDLSPGDSLLDLACGPGYTTATAVERGLDVVGIDLSSRMIEIARSRVPEARFEVADMLHPPFGPWDGIVCRFGAHHVAPAWAKAAHDALAPGGKIALAEFDDIDEAARANGMENVDHWVNLLQRSGFVDITTIRLQMTLPENLEDSTPGEPSEHGGLTKVVIVSGRRA